ncbi:MAG: type II toxin-antitoxin system HicB family antitoxin [Phycisphaeraceae bacterium]|nr:type II toxin-antitoxin system HicB family antitoxin [Phycisphaeraceae bacterium]
MKGRARRRAIEAPFDPAVLRRARSLAARYRLVIERDEDGGYIGRALELPTAMGDGANIAECGKAVVESLTAAVATMIEAGEHPPLPAATGRRQRQLNIRLTDEENLLLEEAARKQGFRGVSDYVRFAALKNAG